MSGLRNRLRKEFQDKEYAHAYVDAFLNASIAIQIKVLREQRGWDQHELVSLTGMKQPRISLLENVNYDMWSISTLKKLAEAFDVTLNVSFESFSNRIKDIENFSRESLERLSRMDDLSFSEQAEPKVLAAANQSILIVNQPSKMSSAPQIHTIADNTKGRYNLQLEAIASNMENVNG